MSENPNTENQNTAPAPAAPAPEPKDSRNGVTRPKAGTKTGRVWEIADQKSTEAGAPAARKDVMAAAQAEGMNEATIATQYGRWRKYHGLGKETAAPSAPADTTVEPPAQ